MGSQWEFYKIARKSDVSINNLAKTFLEDQLNRVSYSMKHSLGTQAWISTEPVLSRTVTKDNP